MLDTGIPRWKQMWKWKWSGHPGLLSVSMPSRPRLLPPQHCLWLLQCAPSCRSIRQTPAEPTSELKKKPMLFLLLFHHWAVLTWIRCSVTRLWGRGTHQGVTHLKHEDLAWLKQTFSCPEPNVTLSLTRAPPCCDLHPQMENAMPTRGG
jgi:hypothetical protein